MARRREWQWPKNQRVAFIGTGGTISSIGRNSLDIVDYVANDVRLHAAEIVARITEGSASPLKARPLRIAAMDLPVPFAHELAAAFRPSRDSVIQRITEWMS